MMLFRARLTAGLQNPKDRSSSFSRVIRRVESELSYLRTIRASWLHGHVSRHPHRTHTIALRRRHYSLDREGHADAIDPPRLDLLGRLLKVLQERVVPVPTSAKRGRHSPGQDSPPAKGDDIPLSASSHAFKHESPAEELLRGQLDGKTILWSRWAHLCIPR
jgi:hypothetical protein